MKKNKRESRGMQWLDVVVKYGLGRKISTKFW